MYEIYVALGGLALAILTFFVGKHVPSTLQPTTIALAKALIAWIIARQTTPAAPSEIVQQYYRSLPEMVPDIATRRKLEVVERDKLLQMVQEQLLRNSSTKPR